jgi:GAF domain-containing protein
MKTPTHGDLFERLGEPARMRQLARYDIFDPALPARLDEVCARIAQRLRAPVSVTSMILDSAQYILGSYGIGGWIAEAQGAPAEWAFCTHTVLAGGPYCIVDGMTDPVQAGNPLLALSGARSYAGVPLSDESGLALGAHCVIDTTPRQFTGEDIDTLEEGAGETMRILQEYRLADA